MAKRNAEKKSKRKEQKFEYSNIGKQNEEERKVGWVQRRNVGKSNKRIKRERQREKIEKNTYIKGNLEEDNLWGNQNTQD